MKSNKRIRLLIIVFLLAIIIDGIYAGHCYGFFKYGGIYSKGNEFKNVYGVVCKNINIRYQKVQSIAITDEWISVRIKLHSIPYFWVGIDLDPIDYYSMFSIYDSLSNMYPNKKISVGVGAVGSSNSTQKIVNGKLTFSKDCFINNECELDFYEMLSYAMNNSNINAIEINYSYGYQFDLLPTSLSKNETVTYLRGFSAYSNDCSVIKSFQELQSLDLSFINDTSDNIINMDFLNNLTKLENLIIYADRQRIDMTGVENLTLKQFTFYTDSYSKEFENQLTYAFPNAEVSIVSDYYDLYSQSIR